MSFLQDLLSRPWRFFRDRTSGLVPEKKGNFGVEITGQDPDTAQYSLAHQGDEQGWGYHEGATSRGFGSWANAVPAIWNKNTNVISIMKDKSQSTDADYLNKTAGSTPGDSYSTVRVAQISSSKILVPGIIATCLNHAAQEQVFFPITTSDVTLSYAKIAWNYNNLVDLCEGQLMSYVSGSFTPVIPAALIWIDFPNSWPNLCFSTAGNNTIFEVQQIGTASRGAVLRDLYIAKKCIYDGGTAIQMLQGLKTYRSEDMNKQDTIDVKFMGNPTPWIYVPDGVPIYTKIGNQSKPNIVNIFIDRDWVGTGNYQHFRWARLQNFSPMIASPVRPILKDVISKIYQDKNIGTDGQPISEYQAFGL